MSRGDVAHVKKYAHALLSLLDRARAIKELGKIEPALTAQDLEVGIQKIADLSSAIDSQTYAAIETAAREVFYKLLASTPRDEHAFGEIWNLFDSILIISDRELCEPGLVFWLIEELLDSQTIDGCRIVFDYLDSRRDRLTAKHFKQKNLIILRSCNELLRRLSRAEDTVFCGRVFIFLFQSFPLGDKSSVNLRGEYHVENVTSFESINVSKDADDSKAMEVDIKDPVGGKSEQKEESYPPQIPEDLAGISDQMNEGTKNVKFGDEKSGVNEEDIDMDQLYEVFWSLQDSFSQPTRLFDDDNLNLFKKGLEDTLRKFKSVQQERLSRGPSKLSDEGARGIKRKRGGQEDELSSSFNPKYLTSRDLFNLEISDLAFRRHILVQSLILLDFLLSLTAKNKKKLENMSNRSVLYSYTLSEDNTKWAASTRNDIATYLQQDPDGKFYYRMVDTVLSRDKNWTHWKAEACPPIERPSVTADEFTAAIKGAQRACVNKRLRPTPLGTLDLNFLTSTGGEDGLEKLKDPARYTIPTVISFERPLADDQFDIEMAKTETESRAAEETKSSKLWKALRVASKTRLGVFDKIDDGKNIHVLFHPEGAGGNERPQTNADADKENSEEAQRAKGTDETIDVATADPFSIGVALEPRAIPGGAPLDEERVGEEG